MRLDRFTAAITVSLSTPGLAAAIVPAQNQEFFRNERLPAVVSCVVAVPNFRR
jgi:hypothetical protein